MRFSVIRSGEAFAGLAAEWEQLRFTVASSMPFLRHDFLLQWWRTLGGGEWADGELFIVIGRSSPGALEGIAPLFFTVNGSGEAALMLLGSFEIADYLDLLVAPGKEAEFISGLFGVLLGPDTPPWSVLDLYNLLEDSASLPLLKAAADGCGWRYTQSDLQRCPYIELPGDWEAYLAQVEKKQRHEIRRKMRRAQEYQPAVTWRFADDPQRLEQDAQDFLTLMAFDPEKERFLTPAMKCQMLELIQSAHRHGYLQLAFLEVGGKKAAAYLNFDHGNRIWVYNSGFDPAFRELSAGWVLLGHLLQWANEHGRERFDFLRGDEEYKYRFGAVDRKVVRLRLEHP